MALRRATASGLFARLINTVQSTSVDSSVSRAFNTGADVASLRSGGGGGDGSIAVERRSDRDRSVYRRPDRFPDVFDPFAPTRNLSQVLSLMDQFIDNPFFSRSIGRTAPVADRRSWEVKEDNDALHLRIEMPGLSKDDVRVSMDQNILCINGEAKDQEEEQEREEEGGNERRRYSSRLKLPSDVYKVDEIKAEMKNGVLKVVVPKIKGADKREVFEVKVE